MKGAGSPCGPVWPSGKVSSGWEADVRRFDSVPSVSVVFVLFCVCGWGRGEGWGTVKETRECRTVYSNLVPDRPPLLTCGQFRVIYIYIIFIMLLYIHIRLIIDGGPRTATSTFTLLLSSVSSCMLDGPVFPPSRPLPQNSRRRSPVECVCVCVCVCVCERGGGGTCLLEKEACSLHLFRLSSMYSRIIANGILSDKYH